MSGTIRAHSGSWSSETARAAGSPALHRSETGLLDGTTGDDCAIDNTPQHTAIAESNDERSAERQFLKGVCT